MNGVKMPYKYRYMGDNGSLIARTFGDKVHSPLNSEEILREGLAAVFKLAEYTHEGIFKPDYVRPLATLDIGSERLELQQVINYAFTQGAKIGNGRDAPPAAESLPRIAEIFPAFRPG